MENSVQDISTELARTRAGLKGGGGGGTFDGMDTRIRELEKGHAVIIQRLDGLDKRMDAGFDRLEKKLDRLPSEWTMARVVFYVMGALMAAAIFGPRLVAMIPAQP
jgi:hypothetical protein